MQTETALTQSTGGGPTSLQPRMHFSEDQIRLVKEQIADGLTDGELHLFLEICTRRNLDPFARQIYAIRRRVKQGGDYVYRMTIQTSIDGFRVIAQRSQQYNGQQTIWYDDKGTKHEVWLSEHPPAAAKVRVWRKGIEHPFEGIARFSEYRQIEGSMWQKMPAGQIAKCAEALALRKAFPEDLSGLYTDDEMGQAEGTVTAGAAANKAPKPERKPDPTPEQAHQLNADRIAACKTSVELAELKLTGHKWMGPPLIDDLRQRKAQRMAELQQAEAPVQTETPAAKLVATEPAPAKPAPAEPAPGMSVQALTLFTRLARNFRDEANAIKARAKSDAELCDELHEVLMELDADYHTQRTMAWQEAPTKTAHPFTPGTSNDDGE